MITLLESLIRGQLSLNSYKQTREKKRKHEYKIDHNTEKESLTFYTKLMVNNRQRTFARILNRFSCIFLVSFSCFRTMDNLQLIIHDIAMTPINTIEMMVQDIGNCIGNFTWYEQILLDCNWYANQEKVYKLTGELLTPQYCFGVGSECKKRF